MKEDGLVLGRVASFARAASRSSRPMPRPSRSHSSWRGVCTPGLSMICGGSDGSVVSDARGTVESGVDARRSEYATNERRLLWDEVWADNDGEEGGSSRVAVAGELWRE